MARTAGAPPGRDASFHEHLTGTEHGIGLIGDDEDLEALPALEVDFSGLA